MTTVEEIQYRLMKLPVCKELVLCESFTNYLEESLLENVSKTTQIRKKIVHLLSTENTLRNLIKDSSDPKQIKQFKSALKFTENLRDKEQEKLRKELHK